MKLTRRGLFGFGPGFVVTAVVGKERDTWGAPLPVTNNVTGTFAGKMTQSLYVAVGTRETWNIDFEYDKQANRLIATPRKVDA